MSLAKGVRDSSGGQCAKVSRPVAVFLKPTRVTVAVAVGRDGVGNPERLQAVEVCGNPAVTGVLNVVQCEHDVFLAVIDARRVP
jgi:hypothetical protein